MVNRRLQHLAVEATSIIDSNRTAGFPLILLPNGSLERYIYVAAGQSNRKIMQNEKPQQNGVDPFEMAHESRCQTNC